MYEVAVIGSGPAGFELACLCAKHKIKTVLIERSLLGGVCLNKGCIPAKFYLNSSLSCSNSAELLRAKNKLISEIRRSAAAYLKSQGIDLLFYQARIMSPSEISIFSQEGRGLYKRGRLKAKNIVIAVGSRPIEFTGLKHNNVVSVEHFLEDEIRFNRYLVAGAGPSGIETAFLLRSLGKEVVLIEKEENILPGFDKDLASKVLSSLRREKISVFPGKDLLRYPLDDFEQIIICAGRRPYSQDSFFDSDLGLEMEHGWVKADSSLRTNIANIYVCGDARGGLFYAYTAEHEARVVMSNILGIPAVFNSQAIPYCVFSRPGLAGVGFNESELMDQGIEYTVRKAAFSAFSSARICSDKQGFIKVFLDKKGYILGAGILSKYAHELIGYFSLCISNRISLLKLKDTVFIHPSLSEILGKIV